LLGQLGDGTMTTSGTPVAVFGITNATSVEAGFEVTCAKLSNGIVKCWGRNDDGRLGDGLGVFASSTPQRIGAGSQCSLDIDGNGSVDALTDLLMLTRARMGMSDAAVTSNAIGAGATRTTWPLIRAHLVNGCKMQGLAP
jgi:hypothetical protein